MKGVWITLGALTLSAGIVMLITAIVHRHKSQAVMRWDHFLPFRKKKEKASWTRKLLAAIGPTLASSPLRRVIQTACFLAFLWLFFVVCWPYDALPEAPGRISEGWQLTEVEQAHGDFVFDAKTPPDWPINNVGDRIYLVDPQAVTAEQGVLSQFEVIESSHRRMRLRPTSDLDDEQIDQLITQVGDWTVHQEWPWPNHYSASLTEKELLPADFFLLIDPLVSLSTAVAARTWVWSIACAAVILGVCILIPRGFCGYLCPLGTLIDFFDWTVSRHVSRFRVPDDGWWVHVKYYLLLSVMICALFGVLVSGYVAAIPIITRAMLFLGEPLQSGLTRGWHQIPPPNAGQFLSVFLFVLVLGLGLLKPRFWCKYVCPSGAIFSVGNLLRLNDRKVESTCVNCNKCVEICPFDAIKADFSTRVMDCTLCQTCAGVCPTHAIKFIERWNAIDIKPLNNPPTNETIIGRRGFVSLAVGTAAAAVGGAGVATATKAFSARTEPVVRPPGSVPEAEFLQLCIRCGECYKVCPYNVLQPMAFEHGLDGLWTPQVAADHAGCAPSCNNCGRVCPTGAIRSLPLEEKRYARMGLAVVDKVTCLPFANRSSCQLCVDECNSAGYAAIEFIKVHTRTDQLGQPIEDSGYVAPVVLADKCVGCGLCQMSCFRVNVTQKKLLGKSAIVMKAGPGNEDRLAQGSYIELQRARRQSPDSTNEAPPDFFVPGPDETDPFGDG